MSQHTLYILMRTDMASMNPGKAMAQASHASALFVNQMRSEPDDTLQVKSEAVEWSEEGNGFGTTIVLACDLKTLLLKIQVAKEYSFVADYVEDKTYPIQDGNTLHLLNVITCGYIFLPERLRELDYIIHDLILHP